MKRHAQFLTPWLALSIVALAGCGGDEADADGTTVGACTIVELGDGKSAIRCPDGSELVVSNGKDGADGESGKDGKDGNDGKDAEPPCSLTFVDGVYELTCGDLSVKLGDECEEGFPYNVKVTDMENDGAETFAIFQASGCTWIRGSLTVFQYSGATLPKALSRIEKVDGNLSVGNNAALTSLVFPNLREVGGVFTVAQNPALQQVGESTALVSAKDGVVISYNAELAAIGGFPALETTRDIMIAFNPKLESIGGFDALRVVERDLAWLQLPSLVGMGTFPALETVGRFFAFQDLALPESLPAFPSLETIGFDFTIERVTKLKSLAGLEALTAIGGDATIKDNPALPQCQVKAFLDAIDIEGSTVSSGNNETATCP